MPTQSNIDNWEEKLEKVISRSSNTNDLDGEIYPAEAVYDDVVVFIRSLLYTTRQQEIEKIIKEIKDDLDKIETWKWTPEDMDSVDNGKFIIKSDVEWKLNDLKANI